jgi:hypothetical protein
MAPSNVTMTPSRPIPHLDFEATVVEVIVETCGSCKSKGRSPVVCFSMTGPAQASTAIRRSKPHRADQLTPPPHAVSLICSLDLLSR